ncbi:MAG: hypothetical protein AAGM22_27965 [Acidobacteriota bacterium]
MSFSHRGGAANLNLETLSAVSDLLLAGLEERYGYDTLWITAGSAVAVLDACLHGEPLRMRDFDLVLLAEREVTREWAGDLGEGLDRVGLRYIPRYLWTRQRFHPERPSEPWVAGWGVIFDARGLEVDLSIYHDAAAHDTNGLLDIHRVRIPINRTRPLRRVVEALRTGSFEGAVAAGLVKDPWRGYAAWRRRSAKVVCWPPIELEPIQGAIRIVRECVQKLGQTTLDPALASDLRGAIQRGSSLDTAHLDSRNLLKVLGDDAAARELTLLAELGIFEDWLPGLGERILNLGFSALAERLREKEGTSVPRVAARLAALLGPMAPKDRRAVLNAVALMEQGLAALTETLLPRNNAMNNSSKRPLPATSAGRAPLDLGNPARK